MKNDLSIVLKYIKSYKARSLAIILSIVLGTALIVGVGTLSRSAQQADVYRMKRELGTHHVKFKDIDKEQLEIVKQGKDIKDISITSYYASTEIGQKLPINIQYASENYLNNDSELKKGRFPKGNNEVVVEEWVLNSMGLELNLNQELTFKLYQKEKPETFKVVGILEDRYKEKQIGVCEMFLALDENNINKFSTYVEFCENSDINKNINNITKKAKLNKEKQVNINKMLVESIQKNGSVDEASKKMAIVLSLFAGLVIYSIYSVSVYQRIREYGVLRALGSTSIKIFQLMFSELLILSVIAMPIGIFIGMGGAQIFNTLVGNIQFEGKISQTPFVVPSSIILLSIACTLLVILLISILTYIKIKKIAPIEAIRKNFGLEKKSKNNNLVLSKLSKNISITKAISFRNIFRDKKSFILIILSMSLGGIMIIKTNYAFSRSTQMNASINKETFMNGDFILNVSGAMDEQNGLVDKQINEIKNIDGISEVKTAKILNTRMQIDKEKILDKQFFDCLKKGGYYGDVLNGLLIDDKSTGDYLIKQKLKGYNDEMLKSLNKYTVSGELDIEKIKKENLAVVYIPHTYEVFEGYKDVGDHTYGKPIVDIKVGDTVKVKYPKGKIDTDEYWKGRGNYEYEEYEFKVGAIVDYPFADNNVYSGDSGVDVIINDSDFKKITNINNYDLVYANMENGENHNVINKKLGKIGSQVPGTTTTDLVKEKQDNEKMTQKELIYEYGKISIIFMISIFNIINNVSYNLTSRTSEFGMLRAVGISEDKFKFMIVFEGLLYGVFSSIVVIVGGILLQLRMYKTYGFETYGIEFAIAYKDYILIVVTNILIGLFATYIPARKIKESNIVESINIVE
ncbi:ABC transporter permease [Romboutsia lituseburensis]|uniref:ABC transporter permease n=1 Tax=Romboutsia lituseburensis TaxID=1537 RepID=UPI00215A7A01|nr:ABC transporter permease [Romboutsia lituseburensis]MCR8745122.1 ABC transporter permease [Romboutsia lituseburensis]